MNYQDTFKRYEIKYILSVNQKESVLRAMAPYMQLDEYGRKTIQNIYFDTDNFRLIRRSIEKPIYKEKLRIRSYGVATPTGNVFVELKKKYKSVVYKRRLVLPEKDVTAAFKDETPLPKESQIGDEIQYFREYYEGLKPKVFLSYEREAFYSIDGADLRITFDDNILYRTDDLSLCSPAYGADILEIGKVLMEIKTSGAIPLWMSAVLTKNRIFRTSFSKYGTAYTDMMNNERILTKGAVNHA